MTKAELRKLQRETYREPEVEKPCCNCDWFGWNCEDSGADGLCGLHPDSRHRHAHGQFGTCDAWEAAT